MNNKKEIVEQIYKLLMGLVDDEIPTDEKSAKPSRSKVRSRDSNKKDKVPYSQNNSNNKFDNMPERNMFKEDTKIDKKLRVVDPCPRTRSFNTIEVSCRVCGKKDSLNPVLVHEPTRYKCNVCSKSGG